MVKPVRTTLSRCRENAVNVLAGERQSPHAAAVGMVGLECRRGTKMSDLAIAQHGELIRNGAESTSSTLSNGQIIILVLDCHTALR